MLRPGVLLSDAGLVFAAASLIATRHQSVRLALLFGFGQAHGAPSRSLARGDTFNTKANGKRAVDRLGDPFNGIGELNYQSAGI